MVKWIGKAGMVAVKGEMHRGAFAVGTLGVLGSMVLWVAGAGGDATVLTKFFDLSVFAVLLPEFRDSGAVGMLVVLLLVQAWMTSMRLRHAGLPAWGALIVFVPKAWILVLSIALLVQGKDDSAETWMSRLSAVLHNRVLLAKAVGTLLVLLFAGWAFNLSVVEYGSYGSLLFLMLPLAVGFVPAYCSTFAGHQTLAACCRTSFTVLLIASGLFLLGGVEGLICIVMALPVAAVPVFLGALLAYALQLTPAPRPTRPPILFAALAFLPLLAFIEGESGTGEPPLSSVTTSIEIAAPPSVVWKNIVAFNELEPPDELMFRAGIAYPIRAEIEGTGVGAVRHCVFSTGPFVEPITVWDEPRLLAFSVTQNPPTMDEMSPYKIRPRHIEGSFVSERGQFKLVDLGGGRTRVEGTTWYRQSFGPDAYWRLWSDHIIHSIHTRVLRHIKRNAEGGATRTWGP